VANAEGCRGTLTVCHTQHPRGVGVMAGSKCPTTLNSCPRRLCDHRVTDRAELPKVVSSAAAEDATSVAGGEKSLTVFLHSLTYCTLCNIWVLEKTRIFILL